jgi:hypothetical protein
MDSVGFARLVDERTVEVIGRFLTDLSIGARIYYHSQAESERLEGVNEIVQVVSKQLVARACELPGLGYPRDALARTIDELSERFDCHGAVDYAFREMAQRESSASEAD